MKTTIAVTLLALAGPAIAQEHPTLPGNPKPIAACIYRALDGFAPGGVRTLDRGDTVDVWMPGLWVMLRKVDQDRTAIDIEPATFRLFNVRSIATRCAGGLR